MGIEPTCEAWKASVLPLNYARFSFVYADFMSSKKCLASHFYIPIMSA